MLNNSIRLFTIRGIEVGVHYSWLFIFALLTWSLSTVMLPAQLGLRPQLEYWVLGVLTALLLFASVLIHELAHSFVALARGLRARAITLFIFGGVSSLSGDPKSATTELLVAIVGPLASFALAALAFGVATIADERRIEAVAGYLFFINVSLGVFNLIPGFPLDGGRVLRAILWGTARNLQRATSWAANVGKVVALLMAAAGAWLLYQGEVVSGVWLGAIAWFLFSAARASVKQTQLEVRLSTWRVRDIYRPLAAAAAGLYSAGPSGAVTIDADVSALAAMDLLDEHDLELVPVVEDGLVTGVVSRSDIMLRAGTVRR